MSENFTLVLLALTFVFASISCGAAVIAVIFARRPASAELAASVDECMGVVEKMMQQQRKVKMSNVRNAAKNIDDHGEASGGRPSDNPSPSDNGNHSGIPASKIALIQHARQKGFRV